MGSTWSRSSSPSRSTEIFSAARNRACGATSPSGSVAVAASSGWAAGGTFHFLGQRNVGQRFVDVLGFIVRGRIAGVKDRHDLVNMNAVLVLDPRAAFQAAAVEVGAVEAGEILDVIAVGRAHDSRVLPRYRVVAEHDVAKLIASDQHFVGRKFVELTFAGASADFESRHGQGPLRLAGLVSGVRWANRHRRLHQRPPTDHFLIGFRSCQSTSPLRIGRAAKVVAAIANRSRNCRTSPSK